jgi:hypothetical protein
MVNVVEILMKSLDITNVIIKLKKNFLIIFKKIFFI